MCSRHWIARVLLATASLALTACGPKLVQQQIFASDEGDVIVWIRHTEDDGEPVPRGYAQPVGISDVRVAHILAQINHKDSDGRQHPTIRSLHVYPLAEGISKALAVATPDDEVVALAYARERRFMIFTADRATAMRVTFEDELMFVEFFAIEEEVEKNPRESNKRRSYTMPDALGPGPSSQFTLVTLKHQVRRPRGVGFDWRDPKYGRPVSLSMRSGQVRRRTILMEAEPDELAPERPHEPIVPAFVRDAQLEALDRLDASRRAGQIGEEEFRRRRRLILEGRLEEAGYGELKPDDE
jgi:hypothetical protein